MRAAWTVIACLCLLGQGAGGEKQRAYVFGPSVPESLPEPTPIELSIEQTVLLALSVNYDISIQRLSTEISRADILRERSAFEPALFGSAGRGNTSDTNFNEFTSDTYNAGLRTRWITGTELSFWAEYAETNDATIGNAEAVAELRQPLLKDGGFAVNRAGLVIARRNRDISIQDLKRQMIDTAAAVQDQYWGLVAARKRATVQEDSLKFARDLAELTMQRAAAGIMGESDTVEAQAAVYARDADVARAAESARSLEDALKEALVLLEEPRTWEAPVVTTTEPTMSATDIDFLNSLSIALKNRPDYDAGLLRLKNADLSLYVAKHQLLPRLDLTAQARRSADVSGAGSALDAVSRDDEQVWSLFLSLEIPLGNKKARADRDQARMTQEQEVLRIKQLELRIIREVRRAVDALNTSRKVVETTAKAVEFETRKLENERTKLALGKSSTDNVVRFIESLNSARLSYIQAVVDFNRSLVRLEQSQGTTLNQYGVTIE